MCTWLKDHGRALIHKLGGGGGFSDSTSLWLMNPRSQVASTSSPVALERGR